MPAKRTKLELYKRHSRCKTLASLQVQPTNPDYFFHCPCNFYVRGSLPSGKEVDRKSLLTNDFATAEGLRQAMKTEDNARAEKAVEYGPPIDECITKFLASWTKEVSGDTLDMHRYVLGVFQKFCERADVYNMGQLTPDLLEGFRVNGFPDVSHNTGATYMSKFVCFLTEAFRLDWITTPLVLKMKKTRADYVPGEPYTAEEITLMRQGIMNLKPGTRYDYHHKLPTALLMLELQLQTGLRISDTTQFDPSNMTPTKIPGYIRYTYVPQKSRRLNKTPKEAETYLDSGLAEAIRNCDWMSKELPFDHSGLGFEVLGQHYYALMQEVGRAVGVKDCRPHRLRDTFAVRMLREGMPLDDLAELLTHKDTKVTRKHYAKWVIERSDRLAEVAAKCHAAACQRTDEEDKAFVKGGAKILN